MKIVILSGNPKKEGLCQSVIEAAKAGATEAGAEVEEIRLCDLELKRCQVCGNGWGQCREEHECIYGSDDSFNDVKARVKESDAIILASPVYWGETTEAFKSFIDRLRRCEFRSGILKDKQVLLIASPGGTGNGLLSSLDQMDRFCRHTGAIIFDYIGINRWNSDYKRVAAKAAAHAMASGRKNGDTV